MPEEVTEDFAPTQEQLRTFAHRLMPEIKSFFADEQIQKEFTQWLANEPRKEKQNATE